MLNKRRQQQSKGVRTMKKTAKALILSLLSAYSGVVLCGAPVVDETAIFANGISWGEQAANMGKQLSQMADQYGKQLEQYKLQLDQYTSELQNLLALPSQTWNGVVGPTNQFIGAVSSLTNPQSGNLQSVLGNFQTLSNYSNNGCVGISGCSASAMAAMNAAQQAKSNAQNSLNNATLQGSQIQQQMQQVDAATLEKLQASAGSATGALQSATAGNQIAAFEAQQMLNANEQLSVIASNIALRNQILADREDMAAAAEAHFQALLEPGVLTTAQKMMMNGGQ